jgi:formate hydrogenlyase subunit 3/multisubunit Na+/H+ antiporter MnhD subunit
MAHWLGAGSCVAGCVAGLVPVAGVLTGGRTLSAELPWTLPHGALNLELDPLSAFFAAAILGLSALAAVYGEEYLGNAGGSHPAPAGPDATARSWPAPSRLPGLPWLHYNLLVAGMFAVVLARNGLLFLLAWEVMSLASFFLVVHDSHLARSREAGWTYLVATHLGTAFLLAFFLVLGRESGSLDFARFPARGALDPSTVSLLLALALVGFGTKAGLVPLHVWLPEAHPAAPSRPARPGAAGTPSPRPACSTPPPPSPVP